MCKHIHLVLTTDKHTQPEYEVQTERDLIEDNEITELHEAVKTNLKDLDTSDLRKRAIDKLRIATTLTEQCTEKEILQEINAQMNTLIGLIKHLSKRTSPVLPKTSQHIPVNKKITTQRPFFSTRKRPKSASVMIAKPSKADKETIANYTDNKKTKCANERNKYVLAEPKLDVKEQYMKEIHFNLLNDSSAWLDLFKSYKREHADLAKRMSKGMSKVVYKIAAKTNTQQNTTNM